MLTYLRVLFIVFFFAFLQVEGAERDPHEVLPDEGDFSDKSIMLLKHLARQPQERVWQRQVELARIKTEADWKSYKEKLLERYRESLGLPFPERTPLRSEVVRVIDKGTYRIEMILYQSMPDIYVTANLYVPQIDKDPYPGILFPCGHSRNGKVYKLYHEAALGLVNKGYVVLVYDPPGQGERYQYLREDGTPLIGKPTSEHTILANPLFLMGKHLMALRLWDGIRGIDYLQSRPEVDPNKIGCTGNSGGGTVTLHLVPLEPRIKAAVPVGTVNSPAMDLGTGYASDGEQNLPFQVPYGLAHADLMMLAYPRPYMLIKESDRRVRTGTRASFMQAHFLYETLGRGERISYVETEWPHGYFKAMREPMYGWFGHWFYQREGDHREPPLELEREEDLLCSESGQILNERGKAIWQWAAEELEAVLPDHPIPEDLAEYRRTKENLKAEAKELLNNPDTQGSPRAVSLGQVETAGRVVEKLVIYSESDIYLPCLYFRAAREDGPTIVIVDSEGASHSRKLAERLSRSGFGVLTADLRSMGETAPESDPDKSVNLLEARILGDEAGGAYDGLKLGRSVFAMRVFDLLQVLEYLKSRGNTRGSPVYVIGRGSTGGIALYAASLDERIAAVAVDRWLATFSDLVTTRDYIWHFMDFLPRVLAFHDLPQVVGSLAPRPVYLLDSLDAEKRRLRTGEVIERYGWAKACYQLLDQRRSLTIGSSQGPEDTESLLLQWVNDVSER